MTTLGALTARIGYSGTRIEEIRYSSPEVRCSLSEANGPLVPPNNHTLKGFFPLSGVPLKSLSWASIAFRHDRASEGQFLVPLMDSERVPHSPPLERLCCARPPLSLPCKRIFMATTVAVGPQTDASYMLEGARGSAGALSNPQGRGA